MKIEDLKTTRVHPGRVPLVGAHKVGDLRPGEVVLVQAHCGYDLATVETNVRKNPNHVIVERLLGHDWSTIPTLILQCLHVESVSTNCRKTHGAEAYRIGLAPRGSASPKGTVVAGATPDQLEAMVKHWGTSDEIRKLCDCDLRIQTSKTLRLRFADTSTLFRFL